MVKKRSRFLDGIGAFLYGVYEMQRKNRISLLLAGALLTVPFGMGAQAADAAGDVNADGASDAEDVALLQNWLLRAVGKSPENRDCNRRLTNCKALVGCLQPLCMVS
ncbi:hypothetical protein [uncultured Ruminococcus sp.]|uniref:hypothetical protein n=1 Tax=uncultured Ruminococcus sp. TaxID=165186 RepID=UPI0025961177|nr:hypothetical protein [uncultured Ruminococcus sp.]